MLIYVTIAGTSAAFFKLRYAIMYTEWGALRGPERNLNYETI